MLTVPFFKQDTGYSCGPATLQMVLRYYNIVMSEEDLIKKLHANKENGTLHKPMIALCQKEGLYVYVNNDSSLEEIGGFLEHKIPVVIHFIEPSECDGHYSVVVGIEDDTVVLNDPWNGEKFKKKKKDFMKEWHSEDGVHKKWMMAVSDRGFPLGKQYLPV